MDRKALTCSCFILVIYDLFGFGVVCNGRGNPPVTCCVALGNILRFRSNPNAVQTQHNYFHSRHQKPSLEAKKNDTRSWQLQCRNLLRIVEELHIQCVATELSDFAGSIVVVMGIHLLYRGCVLG